MVLWVNALKINSAVLIAFCVASSLCAAATFTSSILLAKYPGIYPFVIDPCKGRDDDGKNGSGFHPSFYIDCKIALWVFRLERTQP